MAPAHSVSTQDCTGLHDFARARIGGALQTRCSASSEHNFPICHPRITIELPARESRRFPSARTWPRPADALTGRPNLLTGPGVHDREKGHGSDGADRAPQPRSHRATIRREGVGEEGAMSIHPASIGAVLSDDHPAGDGRWIKPSVACDPPSETPLPVKIADQLLGVDDVGLQLRHEQYSTGRVPGEHIDDPALAIDRERNLRHHSPSASSGESARDCLVERGVPGVDQAIELPAAPAWHQPDLDLERGPHGTNRG